LAVVDTVKIAPGDARVWVEGDYFLVDVFTRRGDAWQASWRISQRLSES